MPQLERIVLTYSFGQRPSGESVQTTQLAGSFVHMGLDVAVCVVEEGEVSQRLRGIGAEVIVGGRSALSRGNRRAGPSFLSKWLLPQGCAAWRDQITQLLGEHGAVVLFDTAPSLLLWRKHIGKPAAPFVLHWKATSIRRSPFGPLAARAADAVVSPSPRALASIRPWARGKPVCLALQSISREAATAVSLFSQNAELGDLPPGDDREVVLLHGGGTLPGKRVWAAVQATVRLRHMELPVRLVVAGPTDGAAADKILRSVPPEHRGAVHFVGWTDSIHELMLHSNIFVHTSHHEGISNVLLEAVAAGLPVVATDVGDTGTIVRHGENGYLVPPGNRGLAVRVANALEPLVRERSLRVAFGHRGQELIRLQHRPGLQAERLRDFIEERLLPLSSLSRQAVE